MVVSRHDDQNVVLETCSSLHRVQTVDWTAFSSVSCRIVSSTLKLVSCLCSFSCWTWDNITEVFLAHGHKLLNITTPISLAYVDYDMFTAMFVFVQPFCNENNHRGLSSYAQPVWESTIRGMIRCVTVVVSQWWALSHYVTNSVKRAAKIAKWYEQYKTEDTTACSIFIGWLCRPTVHLHIWLYPPPNVTEGTRSR